MYILLVSILLLWLSYFIADCPISGQVQVECASPCSTTCSNVNEVLICPTVCVINGCQCPRGTVIDEQSNTCVHPSDCPTGSYFFTTTIHSTYCTATIITFTMVK